MKPEDLTIEMMVEASGPTETWEGQCYGMACIAAELLGGDATAVYGHYLGEVSPDGYWFRKTGCSFIQHGWVLLPDGRVLDPTRWSFENVEPYLYLGEADVYDEGGNAFRQALRGPPPPWRWDPDDSMVTPVNLQTVTSRADSVYRVIVRILGPDEVRFGKWLVITREQLFYVANTHYEMLAPSQAALYKAFEAAGYAEAVPFDNRARAEREAK